MADAADVKYAVTVDFESLEDRQVTVRERDTSVVRLVSFAQVTSELVVLAVVKSRVEVSSSEYSTSEEPPMPANSNPTLAATEVLVVTLVLEELCDNSSNPSEVLKLVVLVRDSDWPTVSSRTAREQLLSRPE